MARPNKNTVDYFPHDCVHKKTLFIVEQKYGNDGYTLWFKTLEMLGRSPNHYLDLSDPENFEYYLATVKLPEERVIEIVDCFAKLGALDKNLWQKKIIWSDNFVHGVADVYRKRKKQPPQKPSNSSVNGVMGDGNTVKGVESTQSKVEETKVKETVVNKPEPSESGGSLNLGFEIQFSENGVMKTLRVDRGLVEQYESYTGTVSHSILNELGIWTHEHGIENVKQAIRIGFESGKIGNLRYINGILRRAKEQGYDWKTKEQKAKDKNTASVKKQYQETFDRQHGDPKEKESAAAISSWIRDYPDAHIELEKQAEKEMAEKFPTLPIGTATFQATVKRQARILVKNKLKNA